MRRRIPDEEWLHRYIDGELAEHDRRQVEAWLSESAEYRARHEELLKLRGMIQVAAEDVMAEVHSDVLYARIARGIEQQAPAGVWERLVAWWRDVVDPRATLWMAAAGASAVAAVLLTLFLPGTQQLPAKPESVEHPTDHAPAAPPTVGRPQAALGAGSEIVQVDFGDNTGTVFEVSVGEGVSTPVVWINDEPSE